jgi:hypothetical protein
MKKPETIIEDLVRKMNNTKNGNHSIKDWLKLMGNNKKTCIILDELDGSDPHAQNKILNWIEDSTRNIPIICTGNESTTIMKRSKQVKLLRCFPPTIKDVSSEISEYLKECQHDIRRVFHRIQYGKSDILPKFILPPTGTPQEKAFIEIQNLFDLKDPLEHLYDKLDNVHLL